MRSLLLELGLIVGSFAFALLCLRGAYKAESKWGQAFGVLLGTAFMLGCLWYYSRTGRGVDETLACTLFSDGEACHAHREDVARPNPPPPKLSVAPRSRGAGARIAGKEASRIQPIKGWWPVGTPAAPPGFLASGEALWRWAMDHPASCEPLRQYVQFFPDGHNAEAARRRLAGERNRIAEKWMLTRSQVARTSRSDSFPEEHPHSDACDALVRGYSNQMLTSFCDGSARGRRFAGSASEIQFLSVEAALDPGGCDCANSWLSNNMRCTARFERWCAFQEKRQIPVEVCPG
jgi:hypothetical protein